jgi:uncharacterized protein YndB with AHSA1/START domain
MGQIKYSFSIKSPIAKVWWAFTTAEGAEQWGAGPAKFDADEGGEFSYWNGDIHGTNTKIISQKLLEQDWYGHDHPSEKYKTSFTFEEQGGVALIHFIYSGRTVDEKKDMSDWRDYYFDPIKQLLEG